jgi:Ser/Thr protein kinase RdoA (MazF antagonist)
MNRPEIARLIVEALGTQSDVAVSRKVLGGHRYDAWLARVDGKHLLAKIPREHVPLDSIDRLKWITDFANQNGILTPRILAIGRSGDGKVPALVVQEYFPGADAEAKWKGPDRSQRRALLTELGREVGRLHGVSAPYFAFSPPTEPGDASLVALLARRLEALLDRNLAAAVVPAEAVRFATRTLERLLGQVSDLQPKLVHSDLFWPNVLLRRGRLACLLDFEHAKFLDPMWDFVKLNLWVFGENREKAEAFLRGYKEEAPYPDDAELRGRIYLGFELLAGLPYWKKTEQAAMLEDYVRRLQEWMRHA